MAGVVTLDPALSLRAAASKVKQEMTYNHGFMRSLMIAGGAGGWA